MILAQLLVVLVLPYQALKRRWIYKTIGLEHDAFFQLPRLPLRINPDNNILILSVHNKMAVEANNGTSECFRSDPCVLLLTLHGDKVKFSPEYKLPQKCFHFIWEKTKGVIKWRNSL